MSLFSARPLRVQPVRFVALPSFGQLVPKGSFGRVRLPPATTSAAGRDRTVLGILAILVSTASFPLSDFAAQSLMVDLPPIEIAWLRYAVFFLSVLPVLGRGPAVLRSGRPGLQVMRGAGSALSTLGAIVAFHFLTVPTATAIGFVAPVMVTALAALILREAVGLRRWAAALVALAGVLVIVQPGGDSFRLAALIPLGGAAASAVAVVCTRLNAADGPGTTVLYSAGTGLLMLTVLVLADWHTPTLPDLGVALIVGLFGALGSALQVFAYRIAPASLLAPFTYTQLIWASGLGFLLFGSAPGAAMAVGGGLIAFSAIYTAWRERQRGIA